MASKFVEQIMQQAISRNDEETQAAVQYIQSESQLKLEEVKTRRVKTIDLVADRLKDLDNMPASVKAAYERLLA